jgi:hypothetical protein
MENDSRLTMEQKNENQGMTWPSAFIQGPAMSNTTSHVLTQLRIAHSHETKQLPG